MRGPVSTKQPASGSIDTVVFDVDGTLVDTNYHHVIAWYRAFQRFDVIVPAWHLHRAIGMGGDMLVAHVAGDEVEERHGDDLRAAWLEEFDPMLDSVVPFARSHELLARVREKGLKVVLGSSGKKHHVDHYLDLLDARDIVSAATSSDDAEESKPHPDILAAAVDAGGGKRAVTLGDSIWDVEAAKRLGVPAVCVRNGGFGVDELRDAGAVEIWESLDELLDGLDRSVLSGRSPG